MKKIILIIVSVCIILSLPMFMKQKRSYKSLTPTTDEVEFSEYRWPTTDIAKRMPVPKSNIGKLVWSADYGFVLYVANTTWSDFNDYADECEKAGFMENYRRGDDYFYGDDKDSYQVMLRFDEGDVMFVRIDEPEEVTEEESETPEKEVIKEEPEESETPEKDISEEVEITTNESEADSFSNWLDTIETPTDPFSDLRHRTTARRAFENYGEYLYPYGIKYHWLGGSTSEYEGDGIWYFKVNVTTTNQYNAEKDATVEGRIDFNLETVSEFNVLPDWD